MVLKRNSLINTEIFNGQVHGSKKSAVVDTEIFNSVKDFRDKINKNNSAQGIGDKTPHRLARVNDAVRLIRRI